jgi:hypothetical protein
LVQAVEKLSRGGFSSPGSTVSPRRDLPHRCRPALAECRAVEQPCKFGLEPGDDGVTLRRREPV